ncbi:MAG: 3-oxoacyl-[acyl-carrier-protein] reductase [Firmicutes bacterium]|jgi:3-oxoacyl-[acyl-carrier protein] reductase|nr:3-oxoacyl-[acyl-carrier-protein] reductase [Bacillota bacterium]
MSAVNHFLSDSFLDGKVAVVTGAGRGIGKTISRILASHGAFVNMVSRSVKNLTEAAESLKGEGLKVEAVLCDVSDPSQVDKAASEILGKHGSIHILVNGAGITKDGLILRMKNEDFGEVLSVNLFGTFYFSRAAARIMIKQKEGKIINIASVVGVIGNPGQANYAASKAGIIGLTKTMAKELASRNITVNALAPGFITTDMTEKLSEKTKIELAERIPMGMLGSPEDVAYAVLFLVSPYSRYITGQVLHVDGGMVM